MVFVFEFESMQCQYLEDRDEVKTIGNHNVNLKKKSQVTYKSTSGRAVV